MLALLFGLTLHGTRRGSLVAFGATVATLAAALTLQPEGVVVAADWISSLLAACVAWLAADNLRQPGPAGRRSRSAPCCWSGSGRSANGPPFPPSGFGSHASCTTSSHSLSVIAVQAGVGSHVIDDDLASARRRSGRLRRRAGMR